MQHTGEFENTGESAPVDGAFGGKAVGLDIIYKDDLTCVICHLTYIIYTFLDGLEDFWFGFG